MFKSVAAQVWHRVFVSYKSTIVGLLCGAGVILFDVLVTSLDGNASPWAKVVATVAVLAGAALRKKALEPVVPPTLG